MVSMEIRLKIDGNPISKKRPRFARRGKFVTTYNDQETEEGRFLWEVKSQFTGEPLSGPLSLEVVFYMRMPKTSKVKTCKMIEGEILPTKKPDLDNLVKFTKDCLNGVAWRDDALVCCTNMKKVYSDQPRTEIVIKKLEAEAA